MTSIIIIQFVEFSHMLNANCLEPKESEFVSVNSVQSEGPLTLLIANVSVFMLVRMSNFVLNISLRT
jgi:hypothetical protein